MKPETPTIAVDVMGSDLGPEEIIIGIKKALSEDKSDFGIIVVGREETITPMLLRHNLIREQRVRVYNASEVIGMDEKPIQAIKTKGLLHDARDRNREARHRRRGFELRQYGRAHGGRDDKAAHHARD